MRQGTATSDVFVHDDVADVSDVMGFSAFFERVIGACNKLPDERLAYQAQLAGLVKRLMNWMETADVARSYLTLNDDMLLFVVIENTTADHDEIQDELENLRVELRDSHAFSLVRVGAVASSALDDSELMNDFINPDTYLKLSRHVRTDRSDSVLP